MRAHQVLIHFRIHLPLQRYLKVFYNRSQRPVKIMYETLYQQLRQSTQWRCNSIRTRFALKHYPQHPDLTAKNRLPS